MYVVLLVLHQNLGVTMIFAILGSLFQILYWVGIVVVVVKVVSGRKAERSPDATPVTVKQVFLYGSLYAAVHVAAWGVAGLIALGGEYSVADQAAIPLALTLVGVPVLVFLGSLVWRSLADPAGRDGVFIMYVNLPGVTGLIVLMASAIVIGAWLVGGGAYPGLALGALAAWLPLWAVHWWLGRRYRADVSNLHVYIGATAGLGTLAVFSGVLVTDLLLRLLDSGTAVDLFRDSDVGTWLVGLAVGAAVFAGYWVDTGMKEARDTLWHSYVVLVGVLGGLITAVVGGGISLYGSLQWWLGDPDNSSAVRHFEEFLPAVSALIVGLGVWFYHRRVLGPSRGARSEVQRVYDYVISTVGLVTGIVGTVILVIGFLEVVFPPEDSMVSEINILLGAVTTLAVGAPVWAQAWMRTNRSVRVDASEAASPTRRVYLFTVVGIAGAVAVVSLIVLLVAVFNEVLGEEGGRLRDDIQVPVALIVAVGAVAVYHFLVLRQERRSTAPAPEPPKQVVLVTADEVFATAVRDLSGARVTVLHRLDANGESTDAQAVAAAVEAAEARNLLVVPGSGGGVQVIPYRR